MRAHIRHNLCVRAAVNEISPMLKLLYRTRWLLTKPGLSKVSRKILSRVGLMSPTPPSKLIPPVDAVLGLNPGELVEVKSREEITETLDKYGTYDRLYFMAEMWQYCGRKSRIYKRVNRVLSEQTGKFKKARNVVLLEGIYCDGSEHRNCDASCFHFWKEVWLGRVKR